MTIPLTASEVLKNHVSLELECIDRMYLMCTFRNCNVRAGLRTSSGFTLAIVLRPVISDCV